jgi:hypothetical protein
MVDSAQQSVSEGVRGRSSRAPAADPVVPRSGSWAVGRRAAAADPDGKSFEDVLEEAEALVQYAASAGIEIDDGIRRSVLQVGGKEPGAWTPEDRIVLLEVLTKLSSKLKPVSGESARKCLVQNEARRAIRTYEVVAAFVVLVILPASYFSFVATAACETIRTDIEAANTLAVTLHGQIALHATADGVDGAAARPRAPDSDELRNLQQFAATMDDVRIRAYRLAKYEWLSGESKAQGTRNPAPAQGPYKLPVPVTDVAATTFEAIKEYQTVRANAQRVREDVATGFGALTACFLPMLYAVLGACAYLARRYEGQMKARTFTGAEKPWVRIFIAGIGGVVVGLFTDFGAGHGTALSPLAIAFLVGYGADVFFVFLDGMLQTFAGSRADGATRAAMPGGPWVGGGTPPASQRSGS